LHILVAAKPEQNIVAVPNDVNGNEAAEVMRMT
jgi:hypothetical protein